MNNNTIDTRTGRTKEKVRIKRHQSARKTKAWLPEATAEINDEPEVDWMNEEDAWFLLSTIFSGKLCRPTPFAEIAQDCPGVWQRALQVFAGNSSAAREWLETRSPIFYGCRPLAVALQIGGRRKVMQELKKLSGSKH